MKQTIVFLGIIHIMAATLSAQPDELRPVPGRDVELRGYMGERIGRNALRILLAKDEEELLAPFRKREAGDRTWLGEHVGKWISAAALSWDYTRDERLGAKLERVVKALIATQGEDGYLGTYAPGDRWKGWDVWVHKYNMLGLLDYHDVTGDDRALKACERMADLLTETFGPDKRDIILSGENVGMAATSVLEPIVRLHRLTGDRRYLHFAQHILAASEQPHGPRIVSSLLRERDVAQVANAKAYEMTSTIIGIIELYRVTDEKDLFTAARIATDDIIANQLYITGGSSFGELWREPTHRPMAGYVAETCVTMSLLHLYRLMFQLTADPKYGDAAEHLICNHLLACQHPSGDEICYYTPLWGHKLYQNFLGCCISSGPRAISTIPSMACFVDDERLVVNLIESGRVRTKLTDGREVEVCVVTDYPFGGRIAIDAKPADSGSYRLAIRIPSCTKSPRVKFGSLHEVTVGSQGEHIELELDLVTRLHRAHGPCEGLFAVQHGPVVYAFDSKQNPGVASGEIPACGSDLHAVHHHGRTLTIDGGPELVPFADAGVDETFFSVYLRDRAIAADRRYSLFTQIIEKCSRQGSHGGSIVDNDPATYTSTDDGASRDEDWFEVHAGWHNKYNVIVFRHGRSVPNGGWFDTSEGKPRVLVKTWHDFEQIGVLEDYPDTTAGSPGTLKDGEAFRFVIPEDKRRADFTIRIVGVPACGNEPLQNHASCSEIQTFYDAESSSE